MKLKFQELTSIFSFRTETLKAVVNRVNTTSEWEAIIASMKFDAASGRRLNCRRVIASLKLDAAVARHLNWSRLSYSLTKIRHGSGKTAEGSTRRSGKTAEFESPYSLNESGTTSRSGSWHLKRLFVFFARLRIHCQADINYLMSPSPIRLSFPMQGQISRNFYCCVILLNTRTCNVNYHWVLRGLAPHTVLNWREYINFKDNYFSPVQELRSYKIGLDLRRLSIFIRLMKKLLELIVFVMDADIFPGNSSPSWQIFDTEPKHYRATMGLWIFWVRKLYITKYVGVIK